MGFVEAIKSGFSNYVNFNGRARRSEYWYWTLFVFIVLVACNVLSSVIPSIVMVQGIFTLAILLPGLAVAVRRLHDIGKSGWFILLTLIPLIGAIILIIWYCKDSDEGFNRFGPSPKE